MTDEQGWGAIEWVEMGETEDGDPVFMMIVHEDGEEPEGPIPTEDDMDDEREDAIKPARQWAVDPDGLTYTAIHAAQPALPPGAYEPVINQAGQLYFVRLHERREALLNFPHTNTGKMIEEIERFWERADDFAQYQLPHKRGVLLYGPPGSGKSCALQLLQRDVIARGGVALIFNQPRVFTGAYRQLRQVQPEVPIVVFMEDIDTLLETKSVESELLQLLDGVEANHKVVFVATTNYLEKLQPRIQDRPSRFDRKFKIPHPDETGRKMYLEFLVGQGAPIDIEKYAKATDGLSLAHLKELFVSTVLLENDFDEAVKYLKDMSSKDGSWNDDAERRPGAIRLGQYA